MRKRLVAVTATLGLGMGLLFAPSAAASEPTVSATAKKKVSAIILLNRLDVEPEQRLGYDRDLFPHWSTQDGCTTREWVLIRQRERGSVDDCKVVNGEWYSPYDGETEFNSRSLDIDHMVPLAEAWDSGASAWTREQRKEFANDLTYKPSLVAVTASSNRSKSDQDPSEWMPPLKSDWCSYLKDWVGVKTRWDLAVDATEKSYIKTTLRSSCGNKKKLRMKRPPVASLAG